MSVRRVLKRLVFSLVPLMLFLATLEGALRIAPDVLAWERRLTTKLAPDAQLYLVTMGDSVTAGANLPAGESWPDQLESLAHAEGIRGLDVVNVASNGNRYNNVEEYQLPAIGRLPKGAGLVVTVLVGHNDFSFWPSASDVLSRRPHDFRAKHDNLRLFNVLLWRLGKDPGYESPLPEVETWIAGELTKIRDEVVAHHGTLYVLSYALPNPVFRKPPSEGERNDLTLYRGCAHEMNRMTMHAAEHLGIATVDLEYDLAIPKDYDPDFWMDRVHFTAKGSRVLAEHMLTRLQRDGAIPAHGD
jgi:lysophospholipase L1-like esterase